MKRSFWPILLLLTTFCGIQLMHSAPPSEEAWAQLSATQRLASVKERCEQRVQAELQSRGLELGSPVFIRIFKEELELELWLQPRPGAAYLLHRRWPIAAMSGQLGPKQKEGDQQAPEGCYSITTQRLNPMSRYHLSFNIGYPNAVDLALKRTGSLIMVHGSCVSIGCFAMTDPGIEDIYLIVQRALQAGQSSISLHSFPFRLTPERLAAAKASPWHSFWSQQLQPIYAAFEQNQKVPTVLLSPQGRYSLKK
jgi:murein L,D-transpeptidase YafK